MQAATYDDNGENDEDEGESEAEDKDSNLFVYLQSTVIIYSIAFNPYNIATKLLYLN